MAFLGRSTCACLRSRLGNFSSSGKLVRTLLFSRAFFLVRICFWVLYIFSFYISNFFFCIYIVFRIIFHISGWDNESRRQCEYKIRMDKCPRENYNLATSARIEITSGTNRTFHRSLLPNFIFIYLQDSDHFSSLYHKLSLKSNIYFAFLMPIS